ncbi:putative F420-0 ABC transporter substrate-binding protein [Cellulomonas sp. P22]|uniref:putative F420-0 ABC transporter substrate-binding protein n=1 Tax=Cellulomonas sp. P22 TaxID=3373189 RepID=UPI0037A01A17
MPAPRPTRSRTRAVLVPALVAAALLAGCTATPGDDAPAAATSAAPTATDAVTWPVTFDNCGFAVTVESPPQRVVTIKSSTFEMMLALGLGDRVVGASFLDGPVPPAYADAADDVEVLSDGAPGQEAVLASEPDLVYAGWESNFADETAGRRDTLEGFGVLSYVSPSACKDADHRPDPLTFDGVFAEITEAGELFGVPDEAADLVAEQRDALAAVTPDPNGRTALWYSSGSDTPYVGAGIGAPQMIMDAVGLTNVAGDVHDTWTSFGWEQVVAADPDVIVLVDATWNTAASKIAQLEANPATATLTAVREHRYLTVPFAATEAGVRNVAAAQDLADQLAALGLDG